MAHSQHSVRVYNAGVDAGSGSDGCSACGGQILAAAGIGRDWLACGCPGIRPRRTVRHAARPRSSRFGFVNAAGFPVRSRRAQLGYSLVDTTAVPGKLATVYVDRVRWLAGQAGADRRRLPVSRSRTK